MFKKRTAGVGYLKSLCKDAICVASSVQETFSSYMCGGLEIEFLREVAFWRTRSSGFLGRLCLTSATLRVTWRYFFLAGAVLWRDGMEKSQNALARGGQFCAQLVSFEGSLSELLRLWNCQLQKLKKSRRISSFRICDLQFFEEVSENCFVMDVSTSTLDGLD